MCAGAALWLFGDALKDTPAAFRFGSFVLSAPSRETWVESDATIRQNFIKRIRETSQDSSNAKWRATGDRLLTFFPPPCIFFSFFSYSPLCLGSDGGGVPWPLLAICSFSLVVSSSHPPSPLSSPPTEVVISRLPVTVFLFRRSESPPRDSHQ